MDKRLKQLFKEAFDEGCKYEATLSRSYSFDYFLKRNKKLLKLYGVVFNEVENYVQTDWKCQKQCDCIDKDDCKEKSEVELCEHPFHLVMSKCNGESNHCLKCGEHF